MGGVISEQEREAWPESGEVLDLGSIPEMPYRDLQRLFERSKALSLSEYVLLFGSTLLLDHSKALGEDKWEVMESIVISTFNFQVRPEETEAGAEVETEAKAKAKIYRWQSYCMDRLREKHGGTFRFKRLVGMQLESRGEIDKALQVYRQLLKFDPEDVEVRRRVISVLFEKNPSLVDDHLNECIMDVTAWKMKAYYLLSYKLDYRSALFCMEEVLLHEPQNLETINTIADIYLALGDYSRSRQYFCLAINIQKSNLRALWGVLHSSLLKTGRLGSPGTSRSKSKSKVQDLTDHDRKLVQLAVKQIISVYSPYDSDPNSGSQSKRDHDLGTRDNQISITMPMIASEMIDYYTSRL
ncbi:TPR domain-containing protein [Cryptosporidium canis]|uniref:ER membrane protein complex subunit 2 n=1 Tax=Cryptosporidium canis TaxID=195482 RepID=A0A9D5DE80_9CRYT|nr:TPR domain-containing protein [Cryptosporidium canis]